MDLTAIHEMLEKAGYKDDEGIANDVGSGSSCRLVFFSFLSSFRSLTGAILLGDCRIPQLSFQAWTGQMQETLNSKKLGDGAFRNRDFNAAIDCYTQVCLSGPGSSFLPVICA